MKSDNAIWNGTSIFVGIIVAIAAFVRGALLLPLLLVACSVWGLYVLHHLRGSLPAVPKKKAKAPRHTKFVVPDIEDEPLSDILLLHVNQRITAALRTAGSNITWEWATNLGRRGQSLCYENSGHRARCGRRSTVFTGCQQDAGSQDCPDEHP